MSDRTEFHAQLHQLEDAARYLGKYGAPGNVFDTLDEIGDVWARLHEAHRQLGVLVDEYATTAGRYLADVEYDPKEGYTLPSGVVVHHATASTDRWEGRRLLTDLSWEMVDPDTGETHQAVPTFVLEQIVPGTASDTLTSSKWGSRGLQNLGIDPDQYRSRDWKQPKLRPGVRR